MSTPSTQSHPLNLRTPTRPIHAGIILLSGTTELLDISPIDILSGMSKDFINAFPDLVLPAAMKEQAFDVVIHYVNETGKPAKLTSGMVVEVTDTFTTCPPLDITLIGATMGNYTPTPTELDFLRTTYASETNQAFLTICGGMMPPLQAGLLRGRRATAPRPMLPMLRKIAPDTEWTERRWERDGKLWTSGTLLNGLDMVRAWVKSVWGSEGEVVLGGGNGGDGERLVDFTLGIGGWPDRDVEYSNVGDEGRWRRTEISMGV